MATEFDKAAAAVRNMTNVSNDQLLELYSLFKQATSGDCNTAKPGMTDLKGKAKWDAWNAKKGMSQDEAKQKYIDAARKHGCSF